MTRDRKWLNVTNTKRYTEESDWIKPYKKIWEENTDEKR